ncbi:peptidoglycan DD-metalloendopeptidase family protein [Sulfurimonas sp.]|uniref:peptidoglycan DD-metalloendopeptidase family protein n=1 Tax=Sulfurimonas sp. TaxID=2022749 RepID=UPI003D0D190F
MVRFFILFLLTLFISSSLMAAHVERHRWLNGETYLVFLEKLNLPVRGLYYNLDKDDQRLTEEMRTGVHYQVLKDNNNNILQILLPLNDELQIHIYKENDNYKFEPIPIISTTKKEVLYTQIDSSPNYAILKKTGSRKVAGVFVAAFKHSLNFKNDIRKGDELVMVYSQKYRLGQPFSMPTLDAAMIEMGNKKHYIYLNDDERYYDENAHEVEGFLLARPVRGARISSYFTKRRWHPVLHKWKAHLGVDYAARSGTPVVAAGSGTIIYAARLGTYGNLIKIRHNDGYETRYAHLKSFRRGIYRGKHVKKGQTIGYVGTTGRSTGPHLHFELRKRGVAINPLRVVQVTTKKLKGKEKKAFLQLKQNYDETIALHLENKTPYVKPPRFEDMCYIYMMDEENE